MRTWVMNIRLGHGMALQRRMRLVMALLSLVTRAAGPNLFPVPLHRPQPESAVVPDSFRADFQAVRTIPSMSWKVPWVSGIASTRDPWARCSSGCRSPISSATTGMGSGTLLGSAQAALLMARTTWCSPPCVTTSHSRSSLGEAFSASPFFRSPSCLYHSAISLLAHTAYPHIAFCATTPSGEKICLS